MKNFINNYIKNEDGLVTMEWIGIAAVVLLAGILITQFAMQGANTAAGTLSGAAGTITNTAQTAADAVDLSGFGADAGAEEPVAP